MMTLSTVFRLYMTRRIVSSTMELILLQIPASNMRSIDENNAFIYKVLCLISNIARAGSFPYKRTSIGYVSESLQLSKGSLPLVPTHRLVCGPELLVPLKIWLVEKPARLRIEISSAESLSLNSDIPPVDLRPSRLAASEMPRPDPPLKRSRTRDPPRSPPITAEVAVQVHLGKVPASDIDITA